MNFWVRGIAGPVNSFLYWAIERIELGFVFRNNADGEKYGLHLTDYQVLGMK